MPWTIGAVLVSPDVQISFRKIDPKNGMVKWSVSFRRHLRPYRCEAYQDRIVVFLYPVDRRARGTLFGEAKESPVSSRSEMVFLDSNTGRTVVPFDTRKFVDPDEDPLIARSAYSSYGSTLDERGELQLTNGWVSYGVAGLAWRNSGTNQIHFFDLYRPDLKWSMTLPDGAYNLVNWSNILIFHQSIKKEGKRVGILYGQNAGHDSPMWQFRLPANIPDRQVLPPPDVIGPPTISRDFTYAVGRHEIFVFGSGNLFALEPVTGATRWRYAVSDDPVIKKSSSRFQYAETLEAGNELMLISEGVMASFNKKSRSMRLLRKDLYDDDLLPMFCDGFIYCFTQHP